MALPPLIAQRILATYDQLGEGPFATTVPVATERERALLGALAMGQPYTAAARTCGVEPGTAKNLVANAVEKLYRLHRMERVERALGRAGTASVTGSPAAIQAAYPPSSTAARSWPIERSIHHSRAAIAPPASS